MDQLTESIGYFVMNPDFYGVWGIIRLIFIIISIILFIGVLYFISRTTWLKKSYLENAVEILTYRPFGVKKTFKQWAKIEKKLESNKEPDLKLAVIEAENLLEQIITKMGYEGETMADKLDQISSGVLPNIEDIKSAHKTRNNIIHDPDYRLTPEQAKKIMKVYEDALRSFEMV